MSAVPAATTTVVKSRLPRLSEPDLPIRGAQQLSKPLVIALDVMGGDKAPGMVLRGAAIALKRFPQVSFLLFGAEDRIGPLLARLPTVAAASTIIHTAEVITGEARPSPPLRTAKRSNR